MAATVRELVAGFEREARDPDIPPARVNAIHVALSSLLGPINAEVRGAQLDYNRVLLDWRGRSDSAADAKMRADVTPEYERLEEAKGTRDAVMEMIRSLRKASDSLREEMKMQR